MAPNKASYKIGREDQIIRVDFTRNPSLDDVKQVLGILETSEDASLRMFVLIKAELLLSTAEVREIAEIANAAANQPRKVALVAPGPVTYSISRILKVFRENESTEMEIFRELDEAERWLLG